jgi:hypothetical protein
MEADMESDYINWRVTHQPEPPDGITRATWDLWCRSIFEDAWQLGAEHRQANGEAA